MEDKDRKELATTKRAPYQWPNMEHLTFSKKAGLTKEEKKDMEKKGQYVPSVDYDTMPMQWYQPGVQPDSWLLPRNWKEIIKWVKAFSSNPYVARIIRIKSLYPLSRFKLKCKDDGVKHFFEKMIHNQVWEIDDVLQEVATSWHKYGEVVGSGKLGKVKYKNKDVYTWEKLALYDPEIIDVVKTPLDSVPEVRLELTSGTLKELKKLLNSDKEEDKKRAELIDEDLKDAVLSGKKYINIDIMGKTSEEEYKNPEGFYMCNAYNLGERGYPEIVNVFKALMKYDRLDRAQIAMADRHSLPLELWSVGHITGNPDTDIIPDDDTLTKIKDIIKQAMYIPPFSIVYTPLLKYEAIGVTGKLLNIKDDIDSIENSIMVGMGMNKNILLSEGPSFSSVGTISLHSLIMEMKVDVNRWERWMKNFLFEPICRLNGWFEMLDGEKKYFIPEIEWEKSMDIEGEDKEREKYYKMWEKGVISTKTLFSKYPEIDYEEERKLLELEKGSIFDSHERLPKTVSKWVPADGEKGEGGAKVAEPRAATPPPPGAKPVVPVKPEKPKE